MSLPSWDIHVLVFNCAHADLDICGKMNFHMMQYFCFLTSRTGHMCSNWILTTNRE